MRARQRPTRPQSARIITTRRFAPSRIPFACTRRRTFTHTHSPATVIRTDGGRRANTAGSLRPRKWTVLPSLSLFFFRPLSRSPLFSRVFFCFYLTRSALTVPVVRVSINRCVPPQLERRAALRNVHGLATKSSSSSPWSSRRYAGEQSRERTERWNNPANKRTSPTMCTESL